MIRLNYNLEIFPEYLAPKPTTRGPNVGLASPIATKILALENPEIWLLPKWRRKLLSIPVFTLFLGRIVVLRT